MQTVVTGVSANLELIERALAAEAQLIVVHHGLFWDGQPRSLDERTAGRLRPLLAAGAALAGYHLPLDAHPEIGNNALLCRELGFTVAEERFSAIQGRPIGIVGRHAEGVPIDELIERVGTAVDRPPLHQGAGPHRVRSVGVVTGAGASAIHEASGLGLDLLLTGEPSEYVMADATETGIHVLAAGHWATETFGVRALGDRIAQRFGVEHRFVAVPNPV